MNENNPLKKAIMHKHAMAMVRSTVRVLILATITGLAGCMAMIHHSVVSGLPTFGETEAAWPMVPAEKGRVVFYWPRLGGLGFNPIPFTGPGGFGLRTVKVDGNQQLTTSMLDQTFVFADLPLGSHAIEVEKAGAFGRSSSVSVSIDVTSGEITFVELRSSQTSEEPPQVVTAQRAREALAAIHHSFKKPMPFYDQDPRLK